MATSTGRLQVTMIGGGMIAQDQILPSLYQLQRLGVVGDITVAARRSATLRALAAHKTIRAAFPGHTFRACPSLRENPKKTFPDLSSRLILQMPPHNLVVVAVPDQFHYPVIRRALEADQHVLAVKPLVLKYRQAVAIEKLARSRGLFVGVEYHKRFDRRSLEAKGKYAEGRFGQFRLGEAKLIEPYYYRHSNFQTWFTKAHTDPFTYIGCHYVDLLYFITGLKPVEVSVRGVEGKFPNGNLGWLWSSGRVVWENGAILSVINGLGYPDEAAGSNDQGASFFFEGRDGAGLIAHNDQFRGVQHCYVDRSQPQPFRFINPDYFRLVPWERDGLKPVGYGYDSIEANVLAAARLRAEADLRKRRSLLAEMDARGILATPANSSINELVIEAGRLSITHRGRAAAIRHGKHPVVRLA
jgi:D-galacturonate reductase